MTRRARAIAIHARAYLEQRDEHPQRERRGDHEQACARGRRAADPGGRVPCARIARRVESGGGVGVPCKRVGPASAGRLLAVVVIRRVAESRIQASDTAC